PEKEKSKTRLPLAVYGYALAMGGVMLAYYSVATNIALYLEQNSLGGATLAGTIVSFTTVGGIITSLLLVRIEMTLNNFLFADMLLGMGIDFLFLAVTNNIALIIFSVCLIGFGQGSLFPTLVLKALDAVPVAYADQAVAWTSSFTFLGQFLSP